jgi:hypothetical protein
VGENSGILPDISGGVPAKTVADVARVACGVLAVHCVEWHAEHVKEFLEWLMELPMPEPAATWALAMAAYTSPEVIDQLRAQSEGRWGQGWHDALWAAEREGISEIDMSPVVACLRVVLPGRWPIDPSW